MKKYLILSFFALVNTIPAKAYFPRDILKKESQVINLSQNILMDNTWNNFPRYSDRDFWRALPEDILAQYIKEAEKYLDYGWLSIKATDYLEFIRTGDRRSEVFGMSRGALLALVMGELVEGKGRFMDQIINGVWFYCEQSWWGLSAHMYLQKAPIGLPDPNDHTIDLIVGEMGNLLSWAWFFFHDEFDKIHPLISARLKDEIQKKVIQPYLERTDFWWLGIKDQSHINNWNPWINFNVLNCLLLIEDDPIKKTTGIQKLICSLDVFLNSYPDDGGCNEGPSYWSAAGAQLYQSLALLEKITSGRFNVFDHPLICNIGTYIYKAYIHYPYFINFSDADSRMDSDPLLIYLYGKSIKDSTLQNFGSFLAQKTNWGKQIFGGTPDKQIISMMVCKEILQADAIEPLIGDFWLPNTEVAGARDQNGSSKGFFFAAKGGFNAESHNHNDVGSCVLYYDGNPVLIDAGREIYTAKTFSRNRYDIWTMQSQYHNLPTINGRNQSAGKDFKALKTSFINTPTKAIFTTDIASAYPQETKINYWKRTYHLQKGKSFTIKDAYDFYEKNEQPSSLNLMTCCSVITNKSGLLVLKNESNSFYIHYNAALVTPTVELISINDKKLKNYWTNGLSRIVFYLKNSDLKGEIITKITAI